MKKLQPFQKKAARYNAKINASMIAKETADLDPYVDSDTYEHLYQIAYKVAYNLCYKIAVEKVASAKDEGEADELAYNIRTKDPYNAARKAVYQELEKYK